MRIRRFFGAATLLSWTLAALLVAGPAVFTGCGGGDAKPKKTKKKPKADGDKGGEKSGDTGAGAGKGDKPASDPDQEAKELIKDTFKGTFDEYMQGNSKIGDLVAAVSKVEEDLAKLKRTSWNETFETGPGGFNNARLEVIAEYDLPVAKNWALDNLDNTAEGVAKLKALSEKLKAMPRDKLAKTALLDNQAKYDDTLQKIDTTIAEVQTLSSLIQRTPPSGETNYLDLAKEHWKAGEGMEWNLGPGNIVLEGKGYITALHYYLKDFKLRLTFRIDEGGFDLYLRALPGKSSTMTIGIGKDTFPETTTINVIVQGNNVRFENAEGEQLDEITSDRAPKGGGITFVIRQGASVNITELTVEPLE